MSARIYHFPFAPVAKPRQTRSDKWRQRPAVVAYRQWADLMRWHANLQGFRFPECGASVTFLLPMPRSWSARKRAAMHEQPHQQKPDVDNLAKAALDALLPDGDERVWAIGRLTKKWSETPGIWITVEDGVDCGLPTTEEF